MSIGLGFLTLLLSAYTTVLSMESRRTMFYIPPTTHKSSLSFAERALIEVIITQQDITDALTHEPISARDAAIQSAIKEAMQDVRLAKNNFVRHTN